MDKIVDYVPTLSPLIETLGFIGGVISTILGGWDAGIAALLIAMGADYITGLVVAGVFHKSPKTADGTIESHAGWKGLCRKGGTLLVILVAAQLDKVLGTTFVRDGVVIAYLVNETISLIENLGLMGVPMVAPLEKALGLLKGRAEKED